MTMDLRKLYVCIYIYIYIYFHYQIEWHSNDKEILVNAVALGYSKWNANE